MKKVIRIVTVFFLILISLIVLVWGGLNIFKPLIYKDFYQIKTNICLNPGLDDGFVCQGIAANEENEIYLISGYMKDKSASRIYITNKENKSRYIKLMKGNEPFTGHVGGIAVTNDTVYVANGNSLTLLSLNTLLDKNTKEIDVGNKIKMPHNVSCVYTDDENLYIGQFHDGASYIIEGHEFNTKDGKYYAFVSAFKLNELKENDNKPFKIFSVRNNVQGFLITSEGKVMLSTSYGLTSSKYYIYETSSLTANAEFEGTPVYFLDSYTRYFEGPAMSEDLDYSNGLALTLSESASDKYIFGKFFFANNIYGLNID